MSQAGFGIYVHWPFCAAKCPYCDFNSHVRSTLDDAAWARAIVRRLEHVAAGQYEERPLVHTVFFGGGTPSLMGGAAAGEVLNAIARLWPMANDVEITLEANPASAEAARFADYRAAGVNRISLGVQALNDADLKFLGRLHDVAEAKAALKLAMQTFERVSLDLIYARPGQSSRAWEAELKEALGFGTEHLSLYQLTIEPQTPFAARGIAVPDDDQAVALYELTQGLTEAAGRPAYEISNHATPGAECRHNLIYWRYGDYVGVGPGAHGRLNIHGKRLATLCERLPERWQDKVRREGHGIAETAEISPVESAREHLLMGLRLSEGIDLDAYRARWGTAPAPTKIAALVGAGFLAQTGSRIAATPTGRIVLNRLIAELAP